MRSGARSPLRPRRALNAARLPAGASSPSAPPRCGCWRPPLPRTGRIRPFSGETDIFITPGYRFKAVDLLLTNFHLPRSTLFMLVAASAGSRRCGRPMRMRSRTGYRFYSYGDACLLSGSRIRHGRGPSSRDGADSITEVRKLRTGIRAHRDSTGHDLCWHHPAVGHSCPRRSIRPSQSHLGPSSARMHSLSAVARGAGSRARRS